MQEKYFAVSQQGQGVKQFSNYLIISFKALYMVDGEAFYKPLLSISKSL